jgi:hypothetical protein
MPRDAKFWIVWPEQRFVSADQIRTWYSDAVANGEMAREYLDLTDVGRMAEGLSDAGMITLGQSIEGGGP